MSEISQNLKIIFIGTPEFGATILKGLIDAKYRPVLVITETDKPVGRKQIITPPPTKILAQKYNIPLLQPERIENCKLKIENLKPDLGIVAAYGQILPRNILDIPKYGCLNVHPSLLPKYRGPSPIQTAILNGDKETGVTIMKMDEKMDHGKIISNSKFLISNKITNFELTKQLAETGAELLIKTIPDWVEGKIKPQEQNEAQATYTKLLKKEDGRIDWNQPADYIDRQTRALNPWPGAHCKWQIAGHSWQTMKVLKAKVLNQTKDGPFGKPGKTFMATNEEIAVQAGKDFFIIEELQVEGKKQMTSTAFLKGHQNFVGAILK
ncbi:MAG: methionyl-tRNA formyltransferase [Candidatus Wildermuthbacteria bacterium]|nr:methionyl-tRNA formyltransferase [Candidatus Wildermuthbacteria bacterium]